MSKGLNSGEVIMAGILDLPAPKSGVPVDAVLASVGSYKEGTYLEGLKAGGITASMYFGCWDIWKTDNGFSGELMRYRSISDSFTDLSLDKALAQARWWCARCNDDDEEDT